MSYESMVDFIDSNPKRKRTVIPIATKLEILKKLNSGIASKTLAQEYGLGQSTIYDIYKNASKILEYASMVENSELITLGDISYIKKSKYLTNLDFLAKCTKKTTKNDHPSFGSCYHKRDAAFCYPLAPQKGAEDGVSRAMPIAALRKSTRSREPPLSDHPLNGHPITLKGERFLGIAILIIC